MPKVTEQHRESRRREIIAAAVRCFARDGFHVTSMSDIIAESGLSAGAIYGYFGSKKELVQAAAAEIYDPARREATDRRDADGAPLHPIEYGGRFMRAMMTKIGDPSIVVQIWGQAAIDDDMRALFDEVYGGLREAIRQQIEFWLAQAHALSAKDAAARSRELAPLVVGIVQGGIVQGALVSGFDVDAYLRVATPLFDAAAA